MSLGTLAKAAMKKDRGLYGGGPNITYPDVPGATDMGAGHQIPFTSEGLTKALNLAKDPSLTGAQMNPEAPVVEEVCGGPLEGRLRWEGFQRLLCFALGFELPNGSDGSPRLLGTGEGTKAVTNATNATPIVVSVASHGYSNGDGVRIAGVLGNTAANGDWSIANVTAGTFELVDSSGNGAYTSGGTAEKYNAAGHVFEGDDTLQDDPWQGEDLRDPGFSANDRKVRRFQLGIAKTVSDHVFYSCLVNKLVISGSPQEVKVAVDLVAYNRVLGSYNSGSWSLPVSTEAQVLFRQLTAKLGARSGGAGGLSTWRPSGFELTIDNKLAISDQSSESGVNHEIPVRDDFREVTLKLDFPRYANDVWWIPLDLGTEFAASLVFDGPAIGATGVNRLIGFYMSSLRCTALQNNVGGPNRIPESVEFIAEKPGGADIFDTAGDYLGVTLTKDPELVVVVKNEDPQNYLTEY